ncbi:11970_t:CDS:1, partial [Diversispora eburnea]
KTMTNFRSTVNLVLQKLNILLTLFYSIFQQAYHVAYKKLENHVLQHPARSLFKAVQIFDSQFLTLTAAN